LILVTLLSPRATPFQNRNSLDAGLQPGLDPGVRAAVHPSRAMLDALAHVMATRDMATAEHAWRVQRLAVALAQDVALGDDFLMASVHAAAPLHDIGKLAIPDSVLHKPGPLTPEEYELVKGHAALGGEILGAIEYGRPLAQIVRHHHENWDGTGYPDGLRGTEIPLGARVLAVVDCYDALTSERPYRQPLTHPDAMVMILERRGTMYDPAILDAFVHVVQRLRANDAVLTRDFVAAHPYRLHPARVI
jgi:HD-GYP domain-containing protein (c-di-GMP phosphodiesterase class II)